MLLRVCKIYILIMLTAAGLCVFFTMLSYFLNTSDITDSIMVCAFFYSIPFFGGGIILGLFCITVFFFKKIPTYELPVIMIIISVASLVFLLPLCFPQIDRIRLKSSKSAHERLVSVHLNDLREALIKYSQDHQGSLPVAEKWASDIEVYADESYVKTSRRDNFMSGYGFNKYLSNLKLKDAAEDSVLLFEVSGDNFNVFGDEEFLKRNKMGNNISIILIDGDIIKCTVKNDGIIYEKDGIKLSNIRWNPTKILKF